jgi:hypothetical protein
MAMSIDRRRLAMGTSSANEAPIKLTAVKSSAKLRALLLMGMTSFEIAVAIGCSVRTVEDRRSKLKVDSVTDGIRSSKFDLGLDNLYSLVGMLASRYRVEDENIRAWLLGRTPYLEEQRPASMLSAGRFDLVREAAIAYAKVESPEEFLANREPIPRVEDSVDA